MANFDTWNEEHTLSSLAQYMSIMGKEDAKASTFAFDAEDHTTHEAQHTAIAAFLESQSGETHDVLEYTAKDVEGLHSLLDEHRIPFIVSMRLEDGTKIPLVHGWDDKDKLVVYLPDSEEWYDAESLPELLHANLQGIDTGRVIFARMPIE